MRVGSVFSGIGGFDLGLERAGMQVVWQVEIDEYRRRVLERHWSDVPRYGDVRSVGGRFRESGKNDAAKHGYQQEDISYSTSILASRCLTSIDLLCGGFPCQDLSVAGKRGGLHAERSGLFFEFVRLARELQPRWILVENVQGLLSSRKGEDFEVVINSFGELGYGLAWRVLDSQHFGVPQRRRRVYIVGRLGGPCPPQVLFEREGGEGDSTAGQKAGEDIANPLGTGIAGSGNPRYDLDLETYVFGPTNRRDGRDWHELRTARAVNTQDPSSPGASSGIVCTPINPSRMRETSVVPRRLDGRRYAALGDAVTVNVIEWIGRRIMLADGMLRRA